MKEAMVDLALVFIGLGGGVAVGSGFVAFIVMLDIIPRLAQVTRTYRYVHHYEAAVVAGLLYWTMADFFGWSWPFPLVFSGVVGLLCGTFVGLLAAALTEIVNVIPILAKRLGMGEYIGWLLLAMILGKVAGSLFEWLIF